jgi:hypothetical protein
MREHLQWRQTAAAEEGAYAGDQFAIAEGDLDEVISAEFEDEDAVRFITAPSPVTHRIVTDFLSSTCATIHPALRLIHGLMSSHSRR